MGARELLRDTARRADDAGRQLTVASLIQERSADQAVSAQSAEKSR